MKVLLTAINAKYIHSNLAVRSLRSYAERYADQIEIAEFTINQYKDYILEEIYRKKPDILAFSCYIWNMEYVLDILENVGLILPETKIWLGGPEVSYDSEQLLRKYSQITGIMVGEGEQIFLDLMDYYLEGNGKLEHIPGIIYREEDTVRTSCFPHPSRYLDMDELPFVYNDMEEFANKIIYYESSRGCPFSCRYCLSSIDRRVRFRALGLVTKELQIFLDYRVPQVKFVDRTFNCNHEHAMGIWRYILEHDNGVTNFHFEIEADLIREDELELLAQMRPGLVQLEIGVQSTNPRTLEAVHRRTDFEKIARVSRRITEGHNIHQHLDLIAGLPYEDYESFGRSFDMVYELHPQELQLGFLKVLKGSGMQEDAHRYGIVYRKKPTYEVLSTRWLTFGEILKLKAVEEMLEVYHNSQQFSNTIRALEIQFPSPFSLYESLAEFYEKKGKGGAAYSRMQRLELLRDFAHETDPERGEWYDEQLILDLYLRENAKTRPAWAKDQGADRPQMVQFYKKEEETHVFLPGYEAYNWKQLMKMTHLEHFYYRYGKEEEHWMLFDYQERDPLTRDARTKTLIFPAFPYKIINN